ncbi:hypothetical protein [Mesorhizobium sp. M0058]|uniref:hypothetical protein n=1 Tax=Mesorhizobium sp. M0058 TaxID=2956865 RepID=UPI00333BF8A5
MPESREIAGGTQGAQERLGFRYSVDERAALLAAGCPEVESLEMLAHHYLQTPTTVERKQSWTEFQASCRRINAAAVQLLEELEAGGHWSQEQWVDDYPERSDLISQLLGLANWSEHAAAHAEDEIPHANANWSWRQFLWELCHFWDRRLGQPVGRRQKRDEVGGPMVAFLVAAAGPVKLVRAPENLGGSMTPEMSSHAIRDYQRFSRNQEEGSRAILAAIRDVAE